MKNIFYLFATLFFLPLSIFAQEKSIKQAKFPYNDVIQWANKGVILVAEDPKGVTFKRTLHFVTNEGEGTWQKEFLPRVKNPIPVSSNESKYIYFFDKVKGLDQMVNFTQFGPSGVSEIKAIKFRNILRQQLGGGVNGAFFKLINIYNAYNDLVFVFSYKDEAKKIKKYAVMRMTHASLTPKCVFLDVQTSFDELEDGKAGEIQCIGSDSKYLYFGQNVNKKDNHSLQLISLDAKNNQSQKYLKFPVAHKTYASNTAIDFKGNVNLINDGEKKIHPQTNGNKSRILKSGILNYALKSKDSKSRDGVRIFLQTNSGEMIWDRNILFSEFCKGDEGLISKLKPEQLALDFFEVQNKFYVFVKGKQKHLFEIDIASGNFKKKDIQSDSNNATELVLGKLMKQAERLEFSLNGAIYYINPTLIEKGQLLLKKK